MRDAPRLQGLCKRAFAHLRQDLHMGLPAAICRADTNVPPLNQPSLAWIESKEAVNQHTDRFLTA